MPGPGGSGGGHGGSHGGGGFHGGGGSHGGGGFHGGPHGGPMHGPHMGGWHWHRPWGYGGGCLSGLFSMLLIPFVVVFMIIIAMVSIFGDTEVEVNLSTGVVYSEAQFQNYADQQYSKAFGDMDDYEDELLIVILSTESRDDYYYIAWVGNDVHADIREMLGGEGTTLDNLLWDQIGFNYHQYSLSADLAEVMRQLAQEIQELDLESSYICGSSYSDYESHIVNYSSVSISESTVNDALEEFTQITGIPTVIVVDEVTSVFETEDDEGDVASVVAIVAVVLVVILIIAAVIKSRRQKAQETQDDPNRRYRNFDDKYK